MSLSSRIADLAQAIASKFNEVKTELSGKANAEHSHSWSQVTGKPTTFAPSAHTHAQGDITGLTSALGGKANASHSHAIADVTNLQTTLNGKAASSHTHTIANVTNLQASLDGKSDTGHGHDWADIIGKPTVFPPAAHSHSATDISTGVLAAARIPTATQAQAEAGTVSTGFMTPLRTKQAISAIVPPATLITGGGTPPANFGPEPNGSFYLQTTDNRVVFVYRKSGNYWEEQVWSDNALFPATTAIRGGVVRATQSETNAGTNTDKYVTPQTLKGAISSGALRGPQVFTGTTNPTSTSGYVIGDVYINYTTGQLWVNE